MGYPGPPSWRLGVRLMTPPHKKYDFENCLKPETNGNNGDNPA